MSAAQRPNVLPTTNQYGDTFMSTVASQSTASPAQLRDKQATFEKISAILQTSLGADPGDIKPEKYLIRDLGFEPTRDADLPFLLGRKFKTGTEPFEHLCWNTKRLHLITDEDYNQDHKLTASGRSKVASLTKGIEIEMTTFFDRHSQLFLDYRVDQLVELVERITNS